MRAGITGWLSRLAGGAEKPNLVAGGSRRQINNTDAARAQGALPLSWREDGHPVVRRGVRGAAPTHARKNAEEYPPPRMMGEQVLRARGGCLGV